MKTEQVREELESVGVKLSLEETVEILENFREHGLIAKVGTSYAVNL